MGGGGSNPEMGPMDSTGKGAAGIQEGVQRGIQCEGRRFGGPFLHVIHFKTKIKSKIELTVGLGVHFNKRAHSVTTSQYIVSRCMLKESLIHGLFVLQVTVLAYLFGCFKRIQQLYDVFMLEIPHDINFSLQILQFFF